MTENELATIIVDSEFKVHTVLGPGLMELKPKMTPEASNIYRSRGDKETFDPSRGRTGACGVYVFYKHAIPPGLKVLSIRRVVNDL